MAAANSLSMSFTSIVKVAAPRAAEPRFFVLTFAGGEPSIKTDREPAEARVALFLPAIEAVNNTIELIQFGRWPGR